MSELKKLRTVSAEDTRQPTDRPPSLAFQAAAEARYLAIKRVRDQYLTMKPSEAKWLN